jgi:hypothetical protein
MGTYLRNLASQRPVPQIEYRGSKERANQPAHKRRAYECASDNERRVYAELHEIKV